ncbi:MAG: lactate utilization protein C [Mobilicoccus sp.]|nr:lactate utilization protein C [Mobilicoccus sp.]
MSAKDEILGRIRTALRDVPDAAADVDVPVTWRYGQPTSSEHIVETFIDRVVDYKATVVRCSPGEVPATIADALTSRGASTVVLPSGLNTDWRDAIVAAGVEVHHDAPKPSARTDGLGEESGPRLSRAELDATDAVVTASCVAAAETGTIMLDHREDQGRRALSLVPDLHVCVVREDQVVSDVPEAVAAIAPSVREHRLPITWISGGSATSDIELSRVEGVHGPRTLVVILAGRDA